VKFVPKVTNLAARANELHFNLSVADIPTEPTKTRASTSKILATTAWKLQFEDKAGDPGPSKLHFPVT
jgi:hypothetical protein